MDEGFNGWPFTTAFPDLDPASGGQEPISQEAWEMLQHSMGLHDFHGFLKHILNNHDGEAKLVVDLGWLPLTEDVNKSEFWDYQFAINPKV